MSTNNLCFGAKIRKIGIPLQNPVLPYKSGVQGIYFSGICFPDGMGQMHMVIFKCLLSVPCVSKLINHEHFHNRKKGE